MLATLDKALLILLIFCCLQVTSIYNQNKHEGMEKAKELLESLLSNYDNRIRPFYGEKPTRVYVQMYIDNMVPLVPVEMHYSVDFFFRQRWRDPRLAHNESAMLSLDRNMLKSMWTPDVYFPGEKQGITHEITTSNCFIRIFQNGTIFYSMRITLSAFCPMDMRSYPFDYQSCSLILESYAFPTTEMRLAWEKNSVLQREKLPIPDFTLESIKTEEITVDYGIAGKYDRLIIYFEFRRNLAYYIFNYYIPCFMMVLLSWVSFWISHKSTPARVALGITTVLTMATLGNSIRLSTPRVDYTKAIDYYLLLCFLYVFAALVEYAAVGRMDPNKAFKKFKRKQELKRAGNSESSHSVNDMMEENQDQGEDSNKGKTSWMVNGKGETIPNMHKRCAARCEGWVEWLYKKMNEDVQEGVEPVHPIDKISRCIFPLTFMIINIIYFVIYIYGNYDNTPSKRMQEISNVCFKP